MKVLMLETGGWGGICHYTYNLCKALAEQNADVTLLTANPYELKDLPHNFDVLTPFTAETNYRNQLHAIKQVYRKIKPDIVHIQSTFSARKDWFFLLYVKLLGIPIVYTAHNILPHDEHENNARGMVWAYGQIYSAAKHIIVHSEDSRQTLQNLFSNTQDKVSVIPHGNYMFVDSETVDSPNASSNFLGLEASKRYLLAFGTIRPYKGTEDLLEAFAKIAADFPDVDLLIAGKPIGQDPNILRDEMQKLGILDRVVFRPDYIDIKDIAHYFIASDVAVYPYHAIYQSGALQLAYAFARPVVATTVGAFPETIDEGQNGLLVPPQDPQALASALRKILSYTPEQRKEMGQHARHLAQTKYAWTSVAGATLKVYHDNF